MQILRALRGQDRRGRARGPPIESDQEEMSDLLSGKYGQKAAESSSAAKRLLVFLAPEIKESNMSVIDQGFMVDAMVKDGFDTKLI